MYGVELVLPMRNRVEQKRKLWDTSKKQGGTKDPSQLPEENKQKTCVVTTLLGVIERSCIWKRMRFQTHRPIYLT